MNKRDSQINTTKEKIILKTHRLRQALIDHQTKKKSKKKLRQISKEN